MSFRVRHAVRAAWAWSLFGVVACEDEPVCTREALVEVLARAAAGDVVLVGACRIDGPIVVPSGVRLEGMGSTTAVTGPAGEWALELTPGANGVATSVAAMRIESDGVAAVVAKGAGEVSLEDVHVTATRGIAIGVEGASVALGRVTLVGPVTDERAASEAYVEVAPGPLGEAGECPPETTCECAPGAVEPASSERPEGRVCTARGIWATPTATIGLVARGADVVARDVEIARFAAIGALFEGGTVSLERVRVRDVLGTGVVLERALATAREVTIERTRQGLRGAPSFGLGAVDVDLSTTALSLVDNERYGLVAVESRGAHTGLVARSNRDVGAWFAGSPSGGLVVHGATAEDNGFAGLVLADTPDASLEDVAVRRTVASTRVLGTFGSIEIGDGLHLAGDTRGIVLRRAVLDDNARAGLVVVLPADEPPTFEEVRVAAAGAAFGAVGGVIDASGARLDPAVLGTWDDGIERLGDAPANDAALMNAIDAIPPNERPRPPDARALAGVVAPMF